VSAPPSSPARGGICFVAPSAYPILAGDRSTPVIGGAEVQQVLLARGFAERGHRVTMVSMDFGQPEVTNIDGVTVFRMHAPMAGLPVLRFIHPRLTSLWGAMRRADADVYYQRGCGALTGQVVARARSLGRASLFAGASDADFELGLRFIPYARDRALYRWGVRRASAIVVQNATQSEACRAVVGRDSTQITSCTRVGGVSADLGGAVLWVGSVRRHKGPLDVIPLAQACPQIRFRVIGDGDAGLMAQLRDAATRLPNLEIVGFVPFVDVEREFDGAFALVNTSPVEGFPNTFLQAWSRGIPTVSYASPGVRHEGRPVGQTATSVVGIGAQLNAWRAAPADWAAAGRDARAFAQQNFSVEAAVQRYEAVLETIAPAMFKIASGSVLPGLVRGAR
jgi:glycosyltransferase involved in cell wall biosynthesis